MKVIRFPVYDNSGEASSTLNGQALAGKSVITVLDASVFLANDYLVIGSLGDENTEIAKILSKSGNDVTLTASLTKDHSTGDVVQLTSYNKYEVYKSEEIDGTYSLVTGTEADIPFNKFEIRHEHTETFDFFYRLRYKNSTTAVWIDDTFIFDSKSVNHLYASLAFAKSQNIVDLSEYTDEQILDYIELASGQVIDYINHDLFYQGVRDEEARTITHENLTTYILTKVRPVLEIVDDGAGGLLDVVFTFSGNRTVTVGGDQLQFFKRETSVFGVNIIDVYRDSRLNSLGSGSGQTLDLNRTNVHGTVTSYPRDATFFQNEQPSATLSYYGGYKNIPIRVVNAIFYYIRNNIDIQSADNAIASGIKKRKIGKRAIEYFGGDQATSVAKSISKFEAEAQRLLSAFRSLL